MHGVGHDPRATSPEFEGAEDDGVGQRHVRLEHDFSRGRPDQRGHEIAQIGDELQRVAGGYIYNTVDDGTGLKGSYDFTLSFSSADKILPTPGDAANSSDPNGALSVFDAVNRQLGLKLEKTKRPYPVLVIDHIEEQPTPN